MSRHSAGDRVDGKFHLDARLFQDRGHFPYLVLGVRYGHAASRDDDHLARIAHHRRGIDGADFLHRAGDRFTTGGTAGHRREQDVRDWPVHRLRHQLRQQRAGGTDDDSGDDQRRITQHIAPRSPPQGR